MLEISNLQAEVDGKKILRGIDLRVKAGEVHAIMGPNGSGKSTLAYAIAGHPAYEITEGQILLDGEDMTEAGADARAQAGIFLAFQYPHAIPGVTVTNFLRQAINAVRRKFMVATPGISTGYWNARNTPLAARSSGAICKRSSPLNKTCPPVTS